MSQYENRRITTSQEEWSTHAIIIAFWCTWGPWWKIAAIVIITAHQAMVEAFGVPKETVIKFVHQHPANELIIQARYGIGVSENQGSIIISTTSKARTESQKEKLWLLLLCWKARRKCEISPEDLMVSITENGDADWSFGLGEAQFWMENYKISPPL